MKNGLSKALLIAGLMLSPQAFANDHENGHMANDYSNDYDHEEKADKGGLFIEPSLTYQWGDTTVSYPAPLDSSDEGVVGLGLGMRLGFHVYESLFLALDGRYAWPEYDSSAAGERVDAQAYNAAATLGLQTPLAGVRVWGSYIFAGELNPDSFDNGVDVKFRDMRGYRVGAGLYVGTVSVNLEYQDADYDNTKLQDAGVFTGTTDSVSAEDRSYILSLSFPMAL